MKSGRGGNRKGAGRKPTGKNPRITITISKENLEWLRQQKDSYGKIVNKLISAEQQEKMQEARDDD